MILADASVWIDHFRAGNADMLGRLEPGEILMHPFVVGEVALGNLRDRDLVLRDLRELPTAPVATADEVATLIETESLYGRGIGYIDAALIASVRLQPGARLWTRDRRFAAVVSSLSLALEID